MNFKFMNSNLFLFIFLFLTFIINANAQSQPSYKIWYVVETQNINKGDTVIFDVGLSGNGYINPKYIKFCLYSDATSKIFIKDIVKPSEIITFGFTGLISSLFISDNVIIPADSKRITVGSHFFIVPETSGDKTIKIIATYSSDSLSWHTEEAFVNFHVNTWYEKWETPLVIVGIIFAIIAIFPIRDIYLYCKKKFFEKPKQMKSGKQKKK